MNAVSKKTAWWAGVCACIRLIVGLYILFPASSQAHPFGSTFFAQQTTLKLEPTVIHVEYVIEVPTTIVMREFYESLEGRAPSREEDALYTQKKLAALFDGLQIQVDGKKLELKNITDPKQKNGVGNMNFFVYRLLGQAEWAPQVGSSHEIAVTNQNYPDLGTYYNQQVWASDAVQVTGSSLWSEGQGEIASDNAGRWQQNPRVRDFTVEVKVTALAGGAPAPVKANPPAQDVRDAGGDRSSTTYYVPEVEGVPLLSYLGTVDLNVTVILLAFGMALFLGAAHALSPGHGKTLVAAYLVGSRGTVRHAILLGLVVTISHTSSVMALGVVTLFAQEYILPERLMTWLGVISGLAIVSIGLWMLVNRWRQRNQSLMARVQPTLASSIGSLGMAHAPDEDQTFRRTHGEKHWHAPGHEHRHGDEHSHGHEHPHGLEHSHAPGHAHSHDHAPGHAHSHEHAHAHGHEHGDAHGHAQTHAIGAACDHHYVHYDDEGAVEAQPSDLKSAPGIASKEGHAGHSHGGLFHSHWGDEHDHDHTHAIPENLRPGQLVRLGIAGGLVPCPMATVVLLTAVALHRLAFGLALIVAFSVGLGAVLVLIGILIVSAKSYVERFSGGGRLLRYLPIVSAVIVTAYGIGITINAWMGDASPLAERTF